MLLKQYSQNVSVGKSDNKMNSSDWL